MFAFFSPERRRFVAVLVFAGFLTLLGIGIFGFPNLTEAASTGKVWTWTKRFLVVGGAVAGVAYSGTAIANALEAWDNILLSLLKGLADWLGKIMLWLTSYLIKVAKYNDFLKARAVEVGWVVVRDVANMFFVLVLLVIAIATILRYEAYSWQQLLPKFFLMAVLINFSKTICGIIIDFAQVVMLTFVNAFAAAAGGNFVQAFGIHKLFTFSTWAEQQPEGAEVPWDVVGQGLLAVVVLLVAAVTVGVLLVVLVIRIVVLWTLIVLSPLAYLLATFPQGKDKAKEWWDMFSKYVISGPVLAFFLWLALVVAGGGDANTQVGAAFAQGELPSDMGDLGDPNNLSSFVVAVVLMLVSLMFTQKLGIAGRAVVGAALSGLKRLGTAPAKMAWRGVKGGVGLAWKGTKAGVKGGFNRAAEALYGATGVALPFSKVRAGPGLRKKRAEAIRSRRLARGMAKTAERMARGRAFMASILDPRAAETLTVSDMAKATVGRPEAERRVQRAADRLKDAAVSEMRSVDALDAERLKHRTEAAMGERQAQPQVRERDRLARKVAKGERNLDKINRDINDNEALIAEIDRMEGLSDRELFVEMSKQKAQAALAQEEERMRAAGRPMTEEEAKKRYQELQQDFLAKEDPEKIVVEERERMAKKRKSAELMAVELGAAKDELEAKLKVDMSELAKVIARLADPQGAKRRALERRDDAERQGNRAEIREIDIELRKIEQAAGLIKVEKAKEFFAQTYEEQLARAKRSAEGESEAAFIKKILAMRKSGVITDDQYKELIREMAKGLKEAKVKLAEIEVTTKQKTSPAT